MSDKSLQENFAPRSICFGCGPANEKGLRIRSFEMKDRCICEWTPQSHHEAFPGMMNGGIIGSLLDCHSNWTAAVHLGRKNNGGELPDYLPCTVTASYSVKLMRPTDSKKPVHITAMVVDSTEDRATIEAEMISDGKVCATCRGTFVAVKEGHPAYHRW
jgi:acyl-coenzyme A thioesterase PaaI-like protein